MCIHKILFTCSVVVLSNSCLFLLTDPQIKAAVLKYLSSPDCSIEDFQSFMEGENSRQAGAAAGGVQGPGRGGGAASSVDRRRNSSPLPSLVQSSQQSTNGSYTKLVDDEENCSFVRSNSDKSTPRFEAYMMTGELILNLSRTQQTLGLVPKQKAVDSLRYHTSVPTSPNESDLGLKSIKGCEAKQDSLHAICSQVGDIKPSSAFSYASGFVRTSRSEDHLQLQKDSISTVDIDIDEDVTSSLNTLLDTRPDAESTSSLATTVVQSKDNDRIVWTYNAPVSSPDVNGPDRGGCSSDSDNLSPQNSVSPNSPTSVSSSVMSSESSKKMMLLMSIDGEINNDGNESPAHLQNGDFSQSEAISNISSPDYQEEESMDILSSKDLMELSDPSDSDSTILVSERTTKHRCGGSTSGGAAGQQRRPAPPSFTASEHRIVLQVKGLEGSTGSGVRECDMVTDRRRLHFLQAPGGMGPRSAYSPDASSGNVSPDLVGYQELRDSEEEVPDDDMRPTPYKSLSPPPPPLQSEDDSDIESLHSFHYSPKAVDIPSAVRLAKRLHSLDGFKKSDVSRHLSKK
jgi:PH/SEC7 domain-containing protein